MLLAADWIAAQLGLDRSRDVSAMGVMLLVFALWLGKILRTGTIRTWEIAAIIVADVLWVLATAVLVAQYFSSLTTVGLLLVDAVAIAVAYFALQQYKGLRGIQR